MNKSQLISAISNMAEIPVNTADQALKFALGCIMSGVFADKQVSIIGFGNFGIRKRSAREVRNLRTGKEMLIAATAVPFNPGKHLKSHISHSTLVTKEISS